MASGSFKNTIYTTSGINIGTVTVNWTSTPNVNTNSSAVTVTGTVANSAKSYRLRNRAYSISCLGSAYHGYTASASDTLANRPFTIYHNADGTKNGVISFYVAGFTFEEEDEEHNITTYTVNAFSVYGNAVLDTIARGSTPTLSASTVAMGNAITINTNRASGSFTHKLTYSFGNTTGTIAENVGASYPWTVPLDLAKQIPTTTSGTVTVYCETFNGSTSLGTKAVTFTATVPDTVKPTISKVVCTDPIGLATTYGGYVQGKSKVNVATTASGAYGSEISTCRVTIGSTTLAGTNVTSDVLYNSGNNSISVTVTDSRGRTASYSTSITVLAYTSPTISKFAAYRCNLDGTENPEGTYLNVSFAGSVTALNNKNSKSFKINYKQESASTYNDWVSYSDAYSYNSSFVGKGYNTGGFSADILWNLLFTVTDDFTSATYEINIPTAEVLMDFLANGKGIAFGKVATEEGFDCNFDARFRKSVRSENDVFANLGTTNQISMNLLNETLGYKLSKNLANPSTTAITWASYGDGAYTTSALDTYGVATIYLKTLITMKANESLYISAKCKLNSGSCKYINYIALYNGSYVPDRTEKQSTLTNEYSLIKCKMTATQDATFDRINIQLGTATSAVLSIKDIMIDKNGDAYEEYSNLTNVDTRFKNISSIFGYTNKNLLKNTATSQTIYGVEFTVNADKSITVNGTATRQVVLELSGTVNTVPMPLAISGCKGGSGDTYSLLVSYYDENLKWKREVYQTDTDILIDTAYPIWQLSILVRNGVTVNTTIFPMVRKADDIDDTYEQYKGTVDERLKAIETALGL